MVFGVDVTFGRIAIGCNFFQRFPSKLWKDEGALALQSLIHMIGSTLTVLRILGCTRQPCRKNSLSSQ